VGGAIDAAGGISNTAVKAVKEMLVGVVEGVKEVGGAVLPKPWAEAETPEIRATFAEGEAAGALKARQKKSK
jgi:hypothetical protein